MRRFEDILGSAQAEVVAIIDRSDPAYIQKTLDTRNPGGAIQAGSKFLDTIGVDDLKGAPWEPLYHPAIKPPAVAFTAPIPGKLGIVEIDKLDDDIPVRFQLSHGGTGGKSGKSAEVVATYGDDLLIVDNTTLIAGPSENGLVVWTFHPGDPAPAFDEITLEQIAGIFPSLRATVADARDLGFRFVKRVDDMGLTEAAHRWGVLAGILRG